MPPTPMFDHEGITLYHGDCLSLLPTLDLHPTVIITDPPYGDTSLTWDQTSSLSQWWPGLVYDLATPSASLWCFGSLRVFYNTRLDPWTLAQDLIWEKQNGSSSHNDRFRWVHEHVVQFYKGPWGELHHTPVFTMDAQAKVVRRKQRPPHWGEIGEGRYTSLDGGPRLARSVLRVRNCHGHAIHPTQKPLGILTPLIEYSCGPDALVMDPFCGSGSTLIACHRAGVRVVGVEQDEEYCVNTVLRLCAYLDAFDGLQVVDTVSNETVWKVSIGMDHVHHGAHNWKGPTRGRVRPMTFFLAKGSLYERQ